MKASTTRAILINVDRVPREEWRHARVLCAMLVARDLQRTALGSLQSRKLDACQYVATSMKPP